MQNAPFHIFTHNTHFGHHPRLLYMRLRRLFFSAIIQCFSLGLSMGSAVCFSHNTIRVLVFHADSPTDEMKRGRMVVLFTSRSWDSLFEASGTRHSWSAWLCRIAQVWLSWCSETYLGYVGNVITRSVFTFIKYSLNNGRMHIQAFSNRCDLGCVCRKCAGT